MPDTPAQDSPLRIAMVDDEPLARLRLSQLCGDVQAQCANTVVGSYASAAVFIAALPLLVVDVVLLDVNMPGLDGLSLAAYLHQHAPQLAVVLVTAAPQHAVAAFEVQVVDFVLKPVRAERLVKALLKVAPWKAAQALAVKAVFPKQVQVLSMPVHRATDGSLVNLKVFDVLYCQADTRYTVVVTAQADYHSAQSLADLAQWLAAQGMDFVRPHRSFLVAKNAISGIRQAAFGAHLSLHGTVKTVPISRRMLGEFKGKLGLVL